MYLYYFCCCLAASLHFSISLFFLSKPHNPLSTWLGEIVTYNDFFFSLSSSSLLRLGGFVCWRNLKTLLSSIRTHTQTAWYHEIGTFFFFISLIWCKIQINFFLWFSTCWFFDCRLLNWLFLPSHSLTQLPRIQLISDDNFNHLITWSIFPLLCDIQFYCKNVPIFDVLKLWFNLSHLFLLNRHDCENVIREMKIDEWKSATNTVLLLHIHWHTLTQPTEYVRRRDVYTNTWTEANFCVWFRHHENNIASYNPERRTMWLARNSIESSCYQFFKFSKNVPLYSSIPAKFIKILLYSASIFVSI